MLSKCSFCSEFNEEEDNNLFNTIIKPVLGINSRILFESNYWNVIPTIGSFISGYFLIVSKEHYISVGKCPENIYGELNNLIKSLEIYIKQKFKLPVAIFEHGSCSISNRGGCCVDHAHIHIMPFEGNVLESIDNHIFTIKTISDFYDLKYQVEKGNSYLFYQNNFGQKYIIQGEYIPSQYFRQIITQRLNLLDRWDWRRNVEIDNIIKNIKEFDSIGMKNIYNEISKVDFKNLI